MEWLFIIGLVLFLFDSRKRLAEIERVAEHLKKEVLLLRARLDGQAVAAARRGESAVVASSGSDPVASPMTVRVPNATVRSAPARPAMAPADNPYTPPKAPAPPVTPAVASDRSAFATTPPAARLEDAAPQAAASARGEADPVEARTQSTGAPPATPPTPPRVPPRRPPAAPEPPQPAFDWESLIGVKLFSWIAGAALALAAVFFLRYSMDHGWLRPEIRLAIGLLSGIGLLVGCELKAARKYPQTANALDASGIAILFSSVYASFALWHLVPASAAFALLIVVTAAAVLLSIRRDSIFIAVLGLLGGFCTPALLSSGQDNPVGLFSYLLLLNAGLAWVAYRQRWPALTALTLVLTTLYQWGWVMKFLTTSKLPVAVAVFLVFPVLSLVSLAFGRVDDDEKPKDDEDSPLFAPSLFANSVRASAALPLLFAFYLAAVPAYGARFGILFGFLLCIVAALFVLAITRGPRALHFLGAVSTVGVLAIWLQGSYTSAAWPWILGFVSAFSVFFLTAPLIAERLNDVTLDGLGGRAVFATPLLLFAFPVLMRIEPATASPLLIFGVLFALLAACAAYAIARREGAVHFIAAFFGVLAEAVWSSRHLDNAHLLPALGIYTAFGLLYIGAPMAARRWKRPLEPAGVAGLLTLTSLALLLFLAAGPVASSAFWGIALLVGVLNAGLLNEAASGKVPALSFVGAVLSWIVLGVWWFTAGVATMIVPSLVVMTAFALLTVGGNLWARSQAAAQGGDLARDFDASVIVGLVGHLFLLFVATRADLSIPPWPLFGVLTVIDLAIVAGSLYLRNARLHLLATVATAAVLAVWTTTASTAPWPTIAVIAAGASVLLAFVTLPLARRVGAVEHDFEQVGGIAVLLAQGVALAAMCQTGAPSLMFTLGAELLLVAAAMSLTWVAPSRIGWAPIGAAVLAGFAAALWQDTHDAPADWLAQLQLATQLYLAFVGYPLLLGRRAGNSRSPYIATVVASAIYFFLARHSLMLGGHGALIGALPVMQALLLVPVLALLVRLEREAAKGARGGKALATDRLALVAGVALAFITVAIPLQLDTHWITIGWALEGLALAWLFGRVPHRGLLAAGVALLATVFVRLALNPAVLTYHPRGAMPILNWYLYTYLVCAGTLLGAAKLLSDTDELPDWAQPRLTMLLATGGTVLLFLLLNIEIADFYATGPTLTFNFSANLAQDLTYTLGWAGFSLALLAVGIVRDSRGVRVASIALLAVTVLKCFLHDLGRLGGLYRVGSFVGLAVCLALVAVVLQKFVLSKGDGPVQPQVRPAVA